MKIYNMCITRLFASDVFREQLTFTCISAFTTFYIHVPCHVLFVFDIT